MADFTVQFDGFAKLERDWLRLAADLGPRRARTVVNAPIRNALRVVRSDIQANTPVDTGGLRQSIRQNTRIASRSELARGTFTRDDVAVGRVGWFWTGESLWFQALAVEYGTRQVAAQNVLRSALERNVDQVLRTLSNDLGQAIERRAAQFARTVR